MSHTGENLQRMVDMSFMTDHVLTALALVRVQFEAVIRVTWMLLCGQTPLRWATYSNLHAEIRLSPFLTFGWVT